MAHVRGTLARWQREASPRVQPHLARWQAALAAGVEVALALAVKASERADTLRQCSPLCGVRTPQERLQVLREWSAVADPTGPTVRALGALAGRGRIPADFKAGFEGAIYALFNGAARAV
jgi:hypothetical protein